VSISVEERNSEKLDQTKQTVKRALYIFVAVVVVAIIGFNIYCRNFAYNENYLQLAKEATEPNANFLFARNATLAGRIYMTITGEKHKSCINTATAFFNKLDTCSNCEDFEENPARWKFLRVDTPQVGDIIIQHKPDGRAYHAVIVVDIRDGKYYINHSVKPKNGKAKYIKNAVLKITSDLTFYRFNPTL
jgi:hypothetical protein